MKLKRDGTPDRRYRPRTKAEYQRINGKAAPYPSRAGFKNSATTVRCIRVAIREAHWRGDRWIGAYAEMRACGCHRKKRFNFSAAIPKHSPKKAYHNLCRRVAQRKGLKSVPAHWLRNAPDIAQFEALADEMENAGYDMTGLEL